ncbi:hypothetical protein FFLO_00240 [Filobasidium floriforme]|uniref:Uncharacterized protein n=1 Tax=Filobasidium floriforme TaxID=5210 RepID=A0A8K0NTX0_9TREE|nr:mitochondrial FAD carrier protein [Filobasidium floriforme]KAG7575421.1 hypothetical protein FFLO_00240 [Filobasidium floriforme]KAH8082555.1 mitochondrial FAD carrier protein [Filobasidium floriforme]
MPSSNSTRATASNETNAGTTSSSTTAVPTRPPNIQYPALFGDASIDHAVAGLGAGTIATLVMHPLDLVKVRFQLATTPLASTSTSMSSGMGSSSSGSASASTSTSASSIRTSTNPFPASTSTSIPSTSSSSTISTPSTSTSTSTSTSILNSRANPSSKPRLGTAVYSALRDAVKQDGPSGLYRGLVPNLVGGASSWGLYFLFYNILKKQMQGGDPNYVTSPSQHLLAAAEASAITAMLTNPIWVVKTRVFASSKNSEAGRAYRGLWHGLTSIYRTEGIRGLYRGSLLALVGVSNGSIQFATYEEIKTRRAAIKRRAIEREGRVWGRGDEKLSNMEYILASGSSKLVAIALTYPYQVVRARIQNAATSDLYPNIPKTISRTFRQEGLRAFYKGLGTNALRILPGTCTTFVVYENLVWGFRGIADWRQQGADGGTADGEVLVGGVGTDGAIVKS